MHGAACNIWFLSTWAKGLSSLAGGNKIGAIGAIFLLHTKPQEPGHLLHEVFPLMPCCFKLLQFVFWHYESVNTQLPCYTR